MRIRDLTVGLTVAYANSLADLRSQKLRPGVVLGIGYRKLERFTRLAKLGQRYSATGPNTSLVLVGIPGRGWRTHWTHWIKNGPRVVVDWHTTVTPPALVAGTWSEYGPRLEVARQAAERATAATAVYEDRKTALRARLRSLGFEPLYSGPISFSIETAEKLIRALEVIRAVEAPEET